MLLLLLLLLRGNPVEFSQAKPAFAQVLKVKESERGRLKREKERERERQAIAASGTKSASAVCPTTLLAYTCMYVCTRIHRPGLQLDVPI